MHEREIFSVQLDCARNAVMTVESIKRFIDYISAMGYNGFYCNADFSCITYCLCNKEKT